MARKSSVCRSARCAGIVVFTPEIWNSDSARTMRVIAMSRFGAVTISLPIKLS